MANKYKTYTEILLDLYCAFGIICGITFTIPFFGFDAIHTITFFLVGLIIIYKLIRIHFLMPHYLFDDLLKYPSKKQLVALCIGFIIGMIMISYCIDSNEETTNQKNTKKQTATISDEVELDQQFRSVTSGANLDVTLQETTDFLTCPKLKEEPNSEYRIYDIAATAEHNIDHFSNKDAQKVLHKLQAAFPDDSFLYRSKDMETYLWYGCLLAYRYPNTDTRSRAGKNLVLVIAPIYHNILGALNDETSQYFKQYKNNLRWTN